MEFAAFALALTSSHASADTFQEMWIGRIARPTADDQEASVYWQDKWNVRGKRFKANRTPDRRATVRAASPCAAPATSSTRASRRLPGAAETGPLLPAGGIARAESDRSGSVFA
jgi:hypothetical protein